MLISRSILIPSHSATKQTSYASRRIQHDVGDLWEEPIHTLNENKYIPFIFHALALQDVQKLVPSPVNYCKQNSESCKKDIKTEAHGPLYMRGWLDTSWMNFSIPFILSWMNSGEYLSVKKDFDGRSGIKTPAASFDKKSLSKLNCL